MKTRTRLGAWVGALLLAAGFAGTAQAVDHYWNGTTNNYTSLNWEDSGGNPLGTSPGSWDSIYNTKGGLTYVTSYANPGYFRFAAGELEIQGGGTIECQGHGGAKIRDGAATITVDGGTFKGSGDVGITAAAGGILNVEAGTVTFRGVNAGNRILVSGGATAARVNHTGGGVTAVGGGTDYPVVIGSQDQWFHENGDYYFGDAAGSAGTISGSDLILGNIANKMSGSGYTKTTYGTFSGWGTVGLTGTLRNNGYVTADGYGTDRTLDVSSFAAIDNTIDNDEYKLTQDNNFYWGKGGTGWFAVDGGALVLPDVAVSTGAGAYNWGEAAADTDIDLINAVRLDFANVTVGDSVSISLLASNRTEVSDSQGTFLGVWTVDATSLAFTTVDLTVRYDDVLAATLGVAEGDIRLYRRDGWNQAWVDVTAAVDTSKNQVTATGVTALGTLAVGKDIMIPPPSGTVVTIK